MGYECIDGHKWKELINQYLPKLQGLQFIMVCKLGHGTDKEQQIDRILDTFRGDFWLDERRCFVRCDWDSDNSNISLYTLPYSFNGFYLSTPILSKTTCLDENNQWSYNSVRALARVSAFTNPIFEFN